MSPIAGLYHEMRRCRRCLEMGYPITPGAIFSGEPKAQVMVVGQAPGVREVTTGLPFSSPAGERLFAWLKQAGFSERTFRSNQYITAITKCFPGKQSSKRGASDKARGDRLPSIKERSLCAPYLEQELEIVQPKLIIPVGRVAIDRFLGKDRLTNLVGNVYEREGRLLLPLPHPSGANLWLNRPRSQSLLQAALEHLSSMKLQMGL